VKLRTPKQIALISTLVIVLPLAAVYFLIVYWLERDFEILLLILFICLAFTISYFVISRYIEKFIYSKVKIIYKTIHSFKSQGDNKQLEMGSDILGEVNEDVAEWANEKIREIKALQNKDDFRKEFVGNLSHELKTPIFSLQGYLETLIDNPEVDSQTRKKFLERAMQSSERLSDLISDLDEISKLESGNVPLQLIRFDLIKLVRECTESLEKSASKNCIQFQIKTEKSVEIWVNADRKRIGQVLTNLLVNSINYGQLNGLTKIRFYDMNDTILVEVADNGIGIGKEHLPRLFERFYRVDKSRSRHEGGSGLGLAICKHIVESHNQTISVRSTEEVGSTFAFTLQKA
jgi:two-component system, OmpR family, phosphate regulon sensor histidine kinase PhoR